MTVVSLSKAARLVGVSRATLLQVVDSGKLPVVEMEEGRRGVDIADLERVYGFLLPDSVADTTVLSSIPPIQPIHPDGERIRDEMVRMRSKLEDAREQQAQIVDGGRGRLVMGFAGLLVVMLAGAVGYRFWLSEPTALLLPDDIPVAGLSEAAPMDLSLTEMAAESDIDEPGAAVETPTLPADDAGYIDTLVVDTPSSPASGPQQGNFPQSREVVAAVMPAGDSSAVIEISEAPPAAEPVDTAAVTESTAPQSELARFMLSLEPGEYVVVVGSFPSEESARDGRDKLRQQHPELFQPSVKPTAGNTEGVENYYQSGKFWVVYVGDFYSRESAERLRGKAVAELGFRDDSFLQRPK